MMTKQRKHSIAPHEKENQSGWPPTARWLPGITTPQIFLEWVNSWYGSKEMVILSVGEAEALANSILSAIATNDQQGGACAHEWEELPDPSCDHRCTKCGMFGETYIRELHDKAKQS